LVDNVLYKGHEAETVVDLLAGRVGHYIFLSTGQVYLVREGVERPFKEEDYPGRLMPAPKPNTYGYEEWLYGVEKREAEDVLAKAWETRQFPYRRCACDGQQRARPLLPAVLHPARQDGASSRRRRPTVPCAVYGGDVDRAIMSSSTRARARGALNGQDETVSLDEFLAMLGQIMGLEPQVVRVKWSLLYANGFLPDCSPFSDRWMSELDNTRSKRELGLSYTPLREVLERLVRHYEASPPPRPTSYLRRHSEKNLVMSM
jgi:nucleoside-diphosphate-sugar epimerase